MYLKRKLTKKLSFLTVLTTFLTIGTLFAQTKPDMWILTDFTGRKTSVNTDFTVERTNNVITKHEFNSVSDPDDYVAMAQYLLLANRFTTVKIVVGSDGSAASQGSNPVTEFNNRFKVAYDKDRVCLSRSRTGYPTSFSVVNASTQGTRFDPALTYKDTTSLKFTVKELVKELKKTQYSTTRPLYVNVWGPMTEVAIAVKHLISNGDATSLSKLYIVSHWTKSHFNQQNPASCFSTTTDKTIFGVANCAEDCAACKYLHDEAKKTGAKFRFAELGSSGQTGIVTGSGSSFGGGFTGATATEFRKSALGKIFVDYKFVSGKPDGSDCATFYAILGTYGVKLSSINKNGDLSSGQEVIIRDSLKNRGSFIIKELLDLSKIAAGTCSAAQVVDNNVMELPSSERTVVQTRQSDLRIYPNPAQNVLNMVGFDAVDDFKVLNRDGKILMTGKAQSDIDISTLSKGMYILESNGRYVKFVKN